MDFFLAVQQSFDRRRTTLRFGRRFEQWRRGSRELRRFSDVDDLLAAVTAGGLGWAPTDAALAALARQAAREGVSRRADDDATCLLLALLIGPLTRRTRDADIAGPLDDEDAQAEVVAGLWEAVVAMGPPCSGVARFLVNAARRRARGAARRELDFRRRRRELRYEVDAAATSSTGNPEEVLASAEARGVLTSLERELIARTRLENVSPNELCEELSRRAAFLRRDRAEVRVVAWLKGLPPPSRFNAGGRRALLGRSGSPSVSGLRGDPKQSHVGSERKEVKTHLDGLVSHSPRRSDATKLSGASDTDG
jgi:DNA-directed RNA polymerase specialized sigma24 family protein